MSTKVKKAIVIVGVLVMVIGVIFTLSYAAGADNRILRVNYRQNGEWLSQGVKRSQFGSTLKITADAGTVIRLEVQSNKDIAEIVFNDFTLDEVESNYDSKRGASPMFESKEYSKKKIYTYADFDENNFASLPMEAGEMAVLSMNLGTIDNPEWICLKLETEII